MEHIKMMEDLMRKSIKIRNSYIEETKVSKNDMLAKAKEKIEKYFDEVLKNCPLKSVRVDLKDKNISISIVKSGGVITKDRHSSKSDTLAEKYVLIEIGDYYYPIKDELVGGYMNQYFYLYNLTEVQILKIIQNFDLIKSEIEKEMIKRMSNILEESTKVVQKEEHDLEILENFLS